MNRSFFVGFLLGLGAWTFGCIALAGIWSAWCYSSDILRTIRRRWYRWLTKGSNSDARPVDLQAARRARLDALVHAGPDRVGVRALPPSVGRVVRHSTHSGGGAA